MRSVLVPLLIVLATPALAQTAAPAPGDKTDTGPTICRREQVTGSRMGRATKTCRTAAEWKQLDQGRTGQQRSATSASELLNTVPRSY